MRSQGFDQPSINDNEVATLKRVIGELTNNLNVVLAKVNSNRFSQDVTVDGDLFVQDIIMKSQSLYLGKKLPDRKLSYTNLQLEFAGEVIGAVMRGVAVFVQETAPVSKQVNDLWIKI